MLKQANDPVSRLYALADLIEHGFNGMGFHMPHWGAETECGTVGCIAGHACAAWAPEVWARHLAEVRAGKHPAKGPEVGDTAAELLGLTGAERTIFYRLIWGDEPTRETAAARLREIAREKETADA